MGGQTRGESVSKKESREKGRNSGGNNGIKSKNKKKVRKEKHFAAKLAITGPRRGMHPGEVPEIELDLQPKDLVLPLGGRIPKCPSLVPLFSAPETYALHGWAWLRDNKNRGILFTSNGGESLVAFKLRCCSGSGSERWKSPGWP